MLIGQVEGFLEVARHENLSRAAEALHVTQPALTARLHALEEELGAALFERSRRGMRLTEAGRALLPYAERAVEALEGGRALVRDLALGSTGELRIGTAPAVGAYVLPRLLAWFTEQSPNVRLVVRTGHSEEILDLVVRGEVDIGLIRELRHPSVEIRPLYDDELLLVVPTAHPFAAEGRIGVERMAEARLILFDRTSSYYELTNAIFRAAGVAPRGVLELDNIDAAKQMVREGLGVALLPMTAVASELSRGTLRSVHLDGVPPIRRRMVAIRRAGPQVTTRVLSAFLAILDRVDEVLPLTLVVSRGNDPA